MRFLIDTHILIWVTYGDTHKLSGKAAAIFKDTADEFLVSMASLWEMAIKKALGKLEIHDALFDNLHTHGYRLLPIRIAHLKVLRALPHHHGDPFDRMLIAQALEENLTLITRDRRFEAYGLKIMLA